MNDQQVSSSSLQPYLFARNVTRTAFFAVTSFRGALLYTALKKRSRWALGSLRVATTGGPKPLPSARGSSLSHSSSAAKYGERKRSTTACRSNTPPSAAASLTSPGMFGAGRNTASEGPAWAGLASSPLDGPELELEAARVRPDAVGSRWGV